MSDDDLKLEKTLEEGGELVDQILQTVRTDSGVVDNAHQQQQQQ
jgi:hypothetical protein